MERLLSGVRSRVYRELANGEKIYCEKCLNDDITVTNKIMLPLVGRGRTKFKRGTKR